MSTEHCHHHEKGCHNSEPVCARDKDACQEGSQHPHCGSAQPHVCSRAASFQEIFHCLIEIRHQTQVAHWTVGGPYFCSWHEMYGKHYEQLNAFIDDYVEALMMHGMVLESCTPSSHKKIQPHCLIGSKKMMQDIMEHTHNLVIQLEKMADVEKRVCLQDILTEGVRLFEKHCWFYKSSLL